MERLWKTRGLAGLCSSIGVSELGSQAAPELPGHRSVDIDQSVGCARNLAIDQRFSLVRN